MHKFKMAVSALTSKIRWKYIKLLKTYPFGGSSLCTCLFQVWTMSPLTLTEYNSLGGAVTEKKGLRNAVLKIRACSFLAVQVQVRNYLTMRMRTNVTSASCRCYDNVYTDRDTRATISSFRERNTCFDILNAKLFLRFKNLIKRGFFPTA